MNSERRNLRRFAFAPNFVGTMNNPSNVDVFDASRRGDVTALQTAHEADPASLNTRDGKGFTPLILAAYNDQPAVVEFLLQNGADVNAQDMAGNTALMGVCFKGYKEIAKKLIDAGADVNLRNANGAPALTFAATFGQLQIAEWLLRNGAQSNLPDSRGKTSLDHAIIQENEEMIELIQRYLPLA
ncbi:ankyrin repeat domain-containing protein [Flavisolibacter ginsenosidimutans]|nr:ankyrin repeat domain-containing protein [Flavisolibacter ginsenosidimutans]